MTGQRRQVGRRLHAIIRQPRSRQHAHRLRHAPPRRSLCARRLLRCRWSSPRRACPTAPVATPAAPRRRSPAATWEQKLAWIVRLEDQRILREPESAGAAGHAAGHGARARRAGAAAALRSAARCCATRSARASPGRAGGRPRRAWPRRRPLWPSCSTDEELEVRQMAAFALGLIGDAARARRAARGAEQRRADAAGPRGRGAGPHRRQGRRAGRRRDGARRTSAAGALRRSPPTIWTIRWRRRSKRRASGSTRWPGWAATTRWRPRCSTNAAAGVALVAGGLRAAAGRRPRAAPALTRAADTPGRYTASFADPRAGRGQGHARPSPQLRQIVEERTARSGGRDSGVRALAALGDAGAVPLCHA